MANKGIFDEQSLYSQFRAIDHYSRLEQELQVLSDEDVQTRTEATLKAQNITGAGQ